MAYTESDSRMVHEVMGIIRLPLSPQRLPAWRQASWVAYRYAENQGVQIAGNPAKAFSSNSFLRRPLVYATRDVLTVLDMVRDGAPTLPRPHERYEPEEAPIVAFAPEAMPTLSDGNRVRAMWRFTIYTDAALTRWIPAIFTQEVDSEGRLVDGAIMLGGVNDTAATVADFHLLHLAFWVIENPDLMKRNVLDVAPRVSKAARRRGKAHEPSPVTIIELREAVKKARDDVAEAERTYRQRWIVRGHWRNQAYGPRRSLRHPVYVAPYVKGPDGAPLNVTTRVGKW